MSGCTSASSANNSNNSCKFFSDGESRTFETLGDSVIPAIVSMHLIPAVYIDVNDVLYNSPS